MASSTEPPFPRKALKELEKRLGRDLKGWEDKAPRFHCPSPGDGVEGAWFDIDAVVRVVQQLRAMPHTKGRWRGTPFEPEAWQIVWILAPVFGWKNEHGHRIVTSLWIEVARKNGKTTLSARLGLLLLAGDGELGAEVYSAAGSKEQAGFLFEPARAVAETAPALKGSLQVLASLIRAPKTGGIFRVLSKAGELAHGASPSGGLIDEIHVHKSRDLIDAIESGTGAREQPLLVYTTTANDGDDTTIYGELHGRMKKLCAGDILDPTTYAVIWAADPQADPFSEEAIADANPNYPISPTRAAIERAKVKARDTPTWLPTYKRLHLNVRATSAAEAWKGAEFWERGSTQSIAEDQAKGAKAWGGLVIASATDIGAIAWCIENPKGKGYWQRWRWFIPDESLDSLNRRTEGMAETWIAQGWIKVTEGGQVDLDTYTEQIRQDCRRFDVQKLAYDPNGSIGVISKLVEDDVVDVIPYYPSNPSSALIDWERLLHAGEIAHGGDPVAAWQVPNLRVKDAATGVTKINRRESTDNVFGLAAAEMALRLAVMEIDEGPGEMLLTYR